MSAGRSVNSQTHHWGTPSEYVAAARLALGGEIHLDPCSNPYSKVSALVEYSLPNSDGLNESWDFPTIYVNPPYGVDRQRGTRIKDWFRKCFHAHIQYRSEVLSLVPVAPNTSHWKEFVWGKAAAIAFLYDTRLKFHLQGVVAGKGAPMACAMVYWGGVPSVFDAVFSEYGFVVRIAPSVSSMWSRGLVDLKERGEI